jgi:glycosyltransferase involved in cell wall biosynthesis
VSGIDTFIGERHPLTRGLFLDIVCPDGSPTSSPFKNIPLKQAPGAPGHIWEQFILPRHLKGGLLSLCNTGPLATKKQIVCIHDLNTRLVPESYDFLFRSLYRVLIPALARRAAGVATVSRYSASTLEQFGIRPRDKTEVIYDGYDHVLGWDQNKSRFVSADLRKPFVLLVGSKAPHKNLGIIFSIAHDLAANGIYTLVAGGEDRKVYAGQTATELPLSVLFLGRVSDDDLAFLYRAALCLAFPSKTEGFGLPALEAMALGCPVVSSDAASLPEVCGDSALYASPADPSNWLNTLLTLSRDEALRRRMADQGRERAMSFSWRTSAEKYLVLMSRIDDGASQKAT